MIADVHVTFDPRQALKSITEGHILAYNLYKYMTKVIVAILVFWTAVGVLLVVKFPDIVLNAKLVFKGQEVVVNSICKFSILFGFCMLFATLLIMALLHTMGFVKEPNKR